jgi:hypothetical protein
MTWRVEETELVRRVVESASKIMPGVTHIGCQLFVDCEPVSAEQLAYIVKDAYARERARHDVAR